MSTSRAILISRRLAYNLTRAYAAHGLVHALRLSLVRPWQYLQRALRPRGSAQRALDREFDRCHGVDTVPDDGLAYTPDIASSNDIYGCGYCVVPADLLQRIIESLGVRADEFSFVDLGAGKGRALLLASGYPFRRVLGVEYCATLCATANENIAIWRQNQPVRCGELRCLHADAGEFTPPAGPLVVYLYNPFEPPALAKVAAALQESYQRQPRPIIVAYYNPVHSGVLEAHGFRGRPPEPARQFAILDYLGDPRHA